METQTKTCQNCKQDFVIDSEDFNFYEKIKVPPPTFCVECQFIRRMIFRNQNSLYKRLNNFPGKEERIISIYSEDKNIVVYNREDWWSDRWDPYSYGMEVDFSKPFLEQVKELMYRVPWPSLTNWNSVNSDYCNNTTDNKNCYLVFGGDLNENCSYGTFNFNSKDSQDLYLVDHCNLCYECVDVQDCYKVYYGQNSKSCTDCTFIYDCINCNDCIGCVSLRNKSYCIFNQQYSKEDYLEKLKDLGLDSRGNVKNIFKKFEDFKLKFPHRYAQIIQSVSCTGDNITKSKNCINCFDLEQNSEDLKNVFLSAGGLKDSRNMSHAGHNTELVYDAFGIFGGSKNVAFSSYCKSSINVRYSLNCTSCINIFGCIGLKSGEYVILNKKYSKEEYEKLVPRIIEHMNNAPYIDKRGLVYQYGEFLPTEFSPFSYNETINFDYFPMEKLEAQSKGFSWKEAEERVYNVDLSSDNLPNSINEVNDDILESTIECLHKGNCNTHKCSKAFKIILNELQFYKRLNLPLPDLCPNCRNYRRMNARNPMKLWSRSCMCDKTHPNHSGRCTEQFETSYAPDRPEIIYCEKCYQAEIY